MIPINAADTLAATTARRMVFIFFPFDGSGHDLLSSARVPAAMLAADAIRPNMSEFRIREIPSG
jgi:hypothetical protein